MNEIEKVKSKDLYLAALRYYDKKANGVELTDTLSYAFLVKVDGNYINIFNPLEMYPVFKRAPYANITMEGLDYGSKMWLLNDVDETGPCYVLFSKESMPKFDGNIIDVKVIENYILDSRLYFKDRKAIAFDRLNHNPFNSKVRKIIKNDSVKEEKMLDFFEKRKVHLQKVR